LRKKPYTAGARVPGGCSGPGPTKRASNASQLWTKTGSRRTGGAGWGLMVTPLGPRAAVPMNAAVLVLTPWIGLPCLTSSM
jgi:hypothetical protein